MSIGRKRRKKGSSAGRPAKAPETLAPQEGRAGEAEASGPEASACPSCGLRLSCPLPPFCPRCGTNLADAQKSASAKRARKKKIKKEIERIGGVGTVRSTNELAPFLHMFESGLAESSEGVFSRTVEFGDISYETERRDVKDDIYGKWHDVHASAKPGSCYQINLVNLPARRHDADRYLPETGANADEARAMNDIVSERQRRGRLEFTRRNFYTLSVEAGDAETADRLLTAQISSVAAKIRLIGTSAEEIGGAARMRLMHDLLKGRGAPFTFDYARLARSRQRARDFVSPGWAAYPAFCAGRRDALMLPGLYVKVFHIKDFGSDLSDRALRAIRALPIPMNVSLLYRPQPRGKVVEQVRRNIAVEQAEIFDYQSAVARSGGDFTHLPPAMEEKEEDSKDLLSHIREDDQDIAWFQGLIAIYADTPEQLERYEAELMDQRETWSIDIVALPLQQEQALPSTLPLANPLLPKKYRSLSNAEAAALIPFSSTNIHDDPARSYLFGYDTISGQAILVDPDKLKSPHGWLFGMTGTGKGMEINSILTYALLQHPRTAYDERTERFETPEARCPQWHVIDFHAEYVELGRIFGASVGAFGPNEESCLNPMALSDEAGELTERDVVANTDFFLALVGSVMDRPLTSAERSKLDKCVRETFAPYYGATARPTLKGLYESLRADKSRDAENLADAIEIFVTGSLSSFARETNFRTDKQMNVYDMSRVGANMQTLAVLSVLQHVRSCTFSNFRIGKPTYCVVEEVQILFDNPAAVALLDSYFSELRKYGLHLICVTQLPDRVLDHDRARHLFENSGFFVFLPQNANNADRIAAMFGLSEAQRQRIGAKAAKGTGLVVVEDVKIPMDNRIPSTNPLYGVWNTDPYRMAGGEEGVEVILARKYRLPRDVVACIERELFAARGFLLSDAGAEAKADPDAREGEE